MTDLPVLNLFSRIFSVPQSPDYESGDEGLLDEANCDADVGTVDLRIE
jgi:hypothetical protein